MKIMQILDFVSKKIRVPISEIVSEGHNLKIQNKVVKGILVTWQATPEALAIAAKKGCNIVICHESFLFDEVPQDPIYRWTSPPGEKPYELKDHPNQIRKRLVEKYGLTILQLHYGLDRITIYEDFMHYLGIFRVVAGDAYEKVYELPKPMTALALAQYVARKMRLPGVRFTGDPKKTIKIVGNLWGGVGLSSNRYWVRKQIENGAEAFICGEMDEIAMCFAREYRNTVMIETSHVLSENIGIRHFVSLLKKEFPENRFELFEVQCPWKMVRA